MKRAFKHLLLLALSILVGCGYHLRGTVALPESLKSLYVFGASSDLQTELVTLLQSSKGKMVNSPNDAGVVIKILKEDLRRRVLSLGSSGKSSEFELQYYLRFQFFDNQEIALQEEQTIELTREYYNDQTAVLAKDLEEGMIRKEMYKQVARTLLSRAQVAVENKQKSR